MPHPLLCATVTAPTTAELRRRRDAVEGADLIELRMDSVADPSVSGALAGRRRPVIVTCRSAREGGSFRGSEGERKALLVEALQRGAEFVDIEASAGFDDVIALQGGRRIVLSLHDFDGVPSDLEDRLVAMRRTGAEVVKAAVMVRSLGECVGLLDVSRRLPKSPAHVLIGMGDAGIATRVLAARFGSCWSYAGDGAAPGQLTVTRMCAELHFKRVFRETAVYGLIGKTVMQSLSPAMHNAGFRAARVDAVYLPLAAASVDDFLRFAGPFDVQGASVTLPFKTDMYDRIDEADAVSRRVGAVNTVRRQGGRWLGINTDVPGFLHPLGATARLANTRAAILGAGGAARAVAVALASAGARVSIHARDPRRAEAVAAIVNGAAGALPPPPGSFDLIVNATPVGMAPHADETPLPGYRFSGETVYDLVYNPSETRLLREAAAAGCRAVGGLGMLIAQAEAAFEWWTGLRPAERVFREAALAGLRTAALSTGSGQAMAT